MLKCYDFLDSICIILFVEIGRNMLLPYKRRRFLSLAGTSRPSVPEWRALLRLHNAYIRNQHHGLIWLSQPDKCTRPLRLIF